MPTPFLPTLNGTLDASGSSSSQHGGGGAGGSIFVRCHKLFGNATAKILAAGGNAGQTQSKTGGGGGGGRIAIWQGKVTQEAYDLLIQGEYPKLSRVGAEHPLFLGTFSAAKGINATYSANDGAPGTALFIDLLPPPGTLLLVR
ncbi:MAG: hypothetical protein GX230_10545 [Lentisphaerae bacterium]|jgi:hypothetical protein|nr:hypothetical protein [Lentisphaerota bacterium]